MPLGERYVQIHIFLTNPFNYTSGFSYTQNRLISYVFFVIINYDVFRSVIYVQIEGLYLIGDYWQFVRFQYGLERADSTWPGWPDLLNC